MKSINPKPRAFAVSAIVSAVVVASIIFIHTSQKTAKPAASTTPTGAAPTTNVPLPAHYDEDVFGVLTLPALACRGQKLGRRV